MATIKSYTTIEQSKKLAEILPLESADMTYSAITEGMRDKMSIKGWEVNIGLDVAIKEKLFSYRDGYMFPCWSLAALLNYLREIDFFPDIEANEHSVTMNINYYDEEEARLLAPIHNIKVEAESFVDACVEMIIKLKELKML